MPKRATFGRAGGVLAPALLGCLAAVSCTDFSTARPELPRGTLGAEIFGVVCDRVCAQSLHEDLSGSSFQAICHGEGGDGNFGTDSFTVDQNALPPIDGDSPTLDGG